MNLEDFDIEVFFDPKAFMEDSPMITESTMTQPIKVTSVEGREEAETEEEGVEETGFEVYIRRRRGGGPVERIPIEQYCGELKQDGINDELIKSMIKCRLQTSAEVRECKLISYKASKGKERC